MEHLYCISGFGADERMFAKLKVPNYQLHHIQWLVPLKKESLKNYAQRMADQIRHKSPVLLGLSFGGIMSIEIAKLLETKAVIIISSVKQTREMPSWMRLAGALKLHRIFPLRSSWLTRPIQNYNLGLSSTEEKALVYSYRKHVDQSYVNWAINTILTWNNVWKPKNLYHIHGTGDRIFPASRVKANTMILKGGHLMILNRAAEINSALNQYLQNMP